VDQVFNDLRGIGPPDTWKRFPSLLSPRLVLFTVG